MAKLKAFIDKLEDAPEAQRELYVEDTDDKGKVRFKLDADGIEDVSALKRTIIALRTDVKTAKDRAKLLEGVDEADVEEIITVGRETIEARKSGKEKPEIEQVKTAMARENKKIIDKLNARLSGAIETIHRLATSAADAEVLQAKGSPAVLRPHIKEQTRVVETQDGDKVKFDIRVVDPTDGSERVDGKGNPLGIKALVAELSSNDEFAGAFEGTGMSGSDTPPDGGGRTPTPPRTPTAPIDAQKVSKRRSNDYGQI